MCADVVRHLTSLLGSRGSQILEPRDPIGWPGSKSPPIREPAFLLTSRLYPHYGNTQDNLYLFHGGVGCSRRLHRIIFRLYVF